MAGLWDAIKQLQERVAKLEKKASNSDDKKPAKK